MVAFLACSAAVVAVTCERAPARDDAEVSDASARDGNPYPTDSRDDPAIVDGDGTDAGADSDALPSCGESTVAGELGPIEAVALDRSGLFAVGASSLGPYWLEDDSGISIYRQSDTLQSVFQDRYGEYPDWLSFNEEFAVGFNSGYDNPVEVLGNAATGEVHSCPMAPFAGAADDGFLYLLNVDYSALLTFVTRAPLATACPTGEVIWNLGWVDACGIALDSSRLYVFVLEENGRYSIRASSRLGGSQTVIGGGVDPEVPYEYQTFDKATLAANHGTVVWAHINDLGVPHFVGIIPSGGLAHTLVVEPDGIGLEPPPESSQRIALALDASYVYWTTRTGLVKRIRICGGTPEILAENQDQPISIAVDDNAIYWLDHGALPGTGKVMRMRKVGGPGYLESGTDASSGDASTDGGLVDAEVDAAAGGSGG